MDFPAIRTCVARTRASPFAAALVLVLLAAGCAPLRMSGAPQVRAAWIQAGIDGWTVRAIAEGEGCPRLQTSVGEFAMRPRAGGAAIAPRIEPSQPQTRVARFVANSCELSLPAGAAALRVGDIELEAPAPEIRRIVLVGDSGCRMKASENAFQDCHDARAWPWQVVATSAAALHPDLVIHLGDYHYRESPCPSGRAGCAGSPWGYGEDVWMEDLFRPAAPLLAAAPWVFVRGNHESCSRAGVGWMRYLDPAPWSPARSCEDPAHDRDGDFGPPFVVPLSRELQLMVFDSSFAGARAYRDGDPEAALYAQQLAQAETLARRRPRNWFANHHPVLGFAGTASGVPKSAAQGLRSVLQRRYSARYFSDDIELVLNGHVHLFEALDFAGGQPAELVLGNSGSAIEGHVDPAAARHAQPAPGAVVGSFVTRSDFGFATLERRDDGWLLAERGPRGEVLQTCTLQGSRLNCEPSSEGAGRPGQPR